jgi:glucan phosphoethanolaminetransferase (alkaline phosphatase superfamily)
MKKPLFSTIAATPDQALFGKILQAIRQKQQHSRLWRIRIFASSAALSLVALVPVVSSLIAAFKASNFGIYLSLIFSDGGFFFSFWKEIGASLVESLPVLTVAVTLALIGILLWSVRGMVRFMNTHELGTV